jgi:hypothetical protein
LDVAGWDVTGRARYRLHDLLRAYARERVVEEPLAQRQAALERALGGWRGSRCPIGLAARPSRGPARRPAGLVRSRAGRIAERDRAGQHARSRECGGGWAAGRAGMAAHRSARGVLPAPRLSRRLPARLRACPDRRGRACHRRGEAWMLTGLAEVSVDHDRRPWP